MAISNFLLHCSVLANLRFIERHLKINKSCHERRKSFVASYVQCNIIFKIRSSLATAFVFGCGSGCQRIIQKDTRKSFWEQNNIEKSLGICSVVLLRIHSNHHRPIIKVGVLLLCCNSIAKMGRYSLLSALRQAA